MVIRAANKVYQVIVSKEAENMILEHVVFLANVSVNAARKLKSDLLTKIKTLEKMPYLYPIFYSKAVKTGYHKLVYKQYIILYTINEEENIVTIELVWDTRQDNSTSI